MRELLKEKKNLSVVFIGTWCSSISNENNRIIIKINKTIEKY